MLRATTACTFATSQLRTLVRIWCALYILTSKCASHCFAPQQRALFQHLNFQKCSEADTFLYMLTSKCASRHNGVQFLDISTSKGGPNLTSKCFSRHNGVHFFNISTSKSVPRLTCFVHFDFEMCFAPQRCALFQHLNFQKCSEADLLFDFEMCFAPQRCALCLVRIHHYSSSNSRFIVSWCFSWII